MSEKAPGVYTPLILSYFSSGSVESLRQPYEWMVGDQDNASTGLQESLKLREDDNIAHLHFTEVLALQRHCCIYHDQWKISLKTDLQFIVWWDERLVEI